MSLNSLDSKEPSVDRTNAPPLRIHHILIVTAVAAVLLSIDQLLQKDQFFGLRELVNSRWGAIFAISTAISLTLVVLGFTWARRGYAFLSMPGHWLLLEQAVGVIFFAALAAMVLAHAMGAKDSERVIMSIYGLGIQFGLVAINFIAAWKTRDSVWWRIYFLVRASLMLFSFIAQIMFPASMQLWFGTVMWLPILTIVAAMTSDVVGRRRRDWLHWTGVAIDVTRALNSMVQMFLRWWK